jgi:hypothetical protein
MDGAATLEFILGQLELFIVLVCTCTSSKLSSNKHFYPYAFFHGISYLAMLIISFSSILKWSLI